MSRDRRDTIPWKIVEIAHGSDEYRALVALREEILRRPLGLHFFPEQLAAESTSHHVACFVEGSLVGGLMLTSLSDAKVQMRQVAVREDFQGRGMGRALVYFAEKWAQENGFSEIRLHARAEAVGFYEKLGYQKIGAPFVEVTLPHWEMVKTLESID